MVGREVDHFLSRLRRSGGVVASALTLSITFACGDERGGERDVPVEIPIAADPIDVRMSEGGLARIREHEAFRGRVYDDGVGNLTIGYGHLVLPGETFPDSLSEADARALFAADVHRVVDPALEKIEVELTQNQIDALGSFIFNVGERAFVRDVLPALNAGDFEGATAEMAKYTRGRNRRSGELTALRGLETRRRSEIELFNSPTALNPAPLPVFASSLSREIST